MKKNEPYKIYKSCSPSKTPVVVEEKDILVVKMTCGGGMGGSCWDEFFLTEDLSSIPSDALHTFTDAITGEEKSINTKYVVKIEGRQMLKVYQDITEWKNYHKKTCDKCYEERYIVLPKGAKWECSDGYGDNKNETVRTFTYEE